MSEYSFRNGFKEESSWNNFKKLDTNGDKKISFSEVKKLDKNNDGVLNDKEFENAGITSTVVQDEINVRLPNLKSGDTNPLDQRVVFDIKKINEKIDKLKCKGIDCLSPTYLTLPKLPDPNHRISDTIHTKYLRAKVVMSPTQFKDLETKLNSKNMNEVKINNLLNKALETHDLFTMADGYQIIAATKNQVRLVEDQNRTLEEKSAIFVKRTGLILTRVLAKTILEQNFDDKDMVKRMAFTSSVTRIGNCGELAAVAAVAARELRGGKVEFFSVQYSSNEQNNHIFVVVNRKEGSDQSKPSSWGDKAIIIDPWREKVYQASDFNKSDEQGLTPIYQGNFPNE